MGDNREFALRKISGLVGLKAIDLQQRIFLWSHLHGNPEWFCWRFRLGAFDKGLFSFLVTAFRPLQRL
jgi:hypothetical protein